VGDFAAGFDNRDFHGHLQPVARFDSLEIPYPLFSPKRFAALAVRQRFDQRGEQQPEVNNSNPGDENLSASDCAACGDAFRF